MARQQFTEELAKLVSVWCSVEQIAQLLRGAKDRSDEVRVSAPKKEVLIDKNLRQAVESGAVPIDKVYDLVREAEENGSQHIFYYRRSAEVDLSMGEIGSQLWGAKWAEKMEFPRIDLVENEFIFADFHAWNAELKPNDWVIKIYGHEYVDRPTEKIEELGDNRFTREFYREARRIVIVIRWNNPGILEVRIPQTDSKKRVKRWLERAWLMINPALSHKAFSPWNLKKARRQMIGEQNKNGNIYRFSTTRVVDGDHNVASFEGYDPQVPLFDSQGVADSVKILLNEGECTNLYATWLTGKNPYPSRELNTLIGHNEPNEIVISGYCSARDVDYVTDQLRHFNR